MDERDEMTNHCTDGKDDHEKVCKSVDDSGKKEC